MRKVDAMALIEEAQKSRYKPSPCDRALIARIREEETVTTADARRIEDYYARATGGGRRVFRTYSDRYSPVDGF